MSERTEVELMHDLMMYSRALAATCKSLSDFISEVAEELSTDRQLDAYIVLSNSRRRLQEAA